MPPSMCEPIGAKRSAHAHLERPACVSSGLLPKGGALTPRVPKLSILGHTTCDDKPQGVHNRALIGKASPTCVLHQKLLLLSVGEGRSSNYRKHTVNSGEGPTAQVDNVHRPRARLGDERQWRTRYKPSCHRGTFLGTPGFEDYRLITKI